MALRRLYVFCEGQTEEAFCYSVLLPHFQEVVGFHIDVCPLVVPGKKGAHSRRNKGGWNSFETVHSFILGIMKEHHGEDAWFTTLLDYYALPSDFPVLANSPASARTRVEALENEFDRFVKTDKYYRFTGHLQLHEFEALLFANLDVLGKQFPERGDGVENLKIEVGGLAPEDINNHPDTAPSKRIIRHVPEYEGRKVSSGPIMTSEIGITRIRSVCPHFNAWIKKIEEIFIAQ